MKEELVVLVTAPGIAPAREIAEALVRENLAACVNIVPAIESVYRWEGRINIDSESLLIVKTTEQSYKRLETRVKELHEYSVPEIIALHIEHGLPEYIDWIRTSTAKDPLAN